MSLAHSVVRLGKSYVALLSQRLELAALDVEEELLRAARALAAMLAIAALATLALAAAAATIVVLLWDRARIAVLVGVTCVFAIAAAATWWRLRTTLRDKPPLLSATLSELRKDSEALSAPHGAGAAE